jgi:phage terminase small subunit
MARGRKPEAPSVKAARGTLRNDRDANKIEYEVPDDPPKIPDTLSPGGQAVWEHELPNVLKAKKAKGVDSSYFARYCELESMALTCFAAEPPIAPPASMIKEINSMAAALGIAGASSRTLVIEAPAEKPKTNPFAGNGRR